MSCSNSSFDNNCLDCNSEKLRIYDPLSKKCLCDIKYYDDGKNELCMPCHYSWYLNFLYSKFVRISYTCKNKEINGCQECLNTDKRIINNNTG